MRVNEERQSLSRALGRRTRCNEQGWEKGVYGKLGVMAVWNVEFDEISCMIYGISRILFEQRRINLSVFKFILY